MGHTELWAVKEERDRIYALPEMSEEDGMRVGDLESEYAEMDGYSAESRAGELLMGVGIPVEQHYGLMSEVAPGWKLTCATWHKRYFQILIFYYLMSQPTTWTFTLFNG